MTDKVYHSFGRTYRSRAAATAIQFGGGSDGWIVPSSQRLMEDPEGDLATGSLNAFGESHSSSSYDVTIDTGEALVGGAYLARDTTTTVTLSSSTTGQTVYVGWGDSQTDSVIIGKSGIFGTNDHKIPIWTFDTDGSGVTTATDERNLDDYRIAKEHVESTVPSGLIAIWSGSISNIPNGWVLCDGNNGTPNLQDRFVVGAGSTYTVDSTGGQSTVQLTVDEMPSHAHGYTKPTEGQGGSSANFATTSSATTDSAGGDSAHENKPPYYALAYIMKV